MNGHRIILGSGVVIFLIGIVFWAGSTYTRIGSIELHLISIDSQIAKVVDNQADIRSLEDQVKENEIKIERLEDQVRQLK